MSRPPGPINPHFLHKKKERIKKMTARAGAAASVICFLFSKCTVYKVMGKDMTGHTHEYTRSKLYLWMI